MLDAVIGEASDQLRETERLFEGDEFDRAVDIIDSASTVMTFGVGISKVVAEYLALRMNRVGVRADLAPGMGFALADDLLRLRKGDCVVIFAPGRLAHEVEVIIEHAKFLDLSLILITDTLHNQLKEKVAVHLRAPLSASRLTGEMLSASIISDALLLGLAKKRNAEATRSYKTLTSLRRRLIGRRR
jgi:DNA-binding MurR/RpiR family transcriptional regulator